MCRAEVAQSVEQRTENPCVSSSILLLGTLKYISAEVAEWQTRQSQKLLGGNSRVGSNPTFGSDIMPSCVAVARGTLNPLAQVRILARQPDLR